MKSNNIRDIELARDKKWFYIKNAIIIEYGFYQLLNLFRKFAKKTLSGG